MNHILFPVLKSFHMINKLSEVPLSCLLSFKLDNVQRNPNSAKHLALIYNMHQNKLFAFPVSILFFKLKVFISRSVHQ